MIPLKNIKAKSGKMKKKKDGKMMKSPAYFKRDISSFIKKLNEQLKK